MIPNREAVLDKSLWHWFMAGDAMSLTVATALLLVFFACYKHSFDVRCASNIPRVRDFGNNRFSLRTRLSYFTDCQQLYREAYEKYSKKGMTCLVPGLGTKEEVILPNSSLRWLTAQPDHVIGVYEAHAEFDQAEWTLGHPKYILNAWNGMLVKRDISRVLEILAAAINDELGLAFDRWFSASDHWTELKVMESMKLIVAQASSRFTVGTALCRDENYLRNCIAWVDQFVNVAAIIGLLPTSIKPLLGPVIASPLRYHSRKIRNAFKPLFEERMKLIFADEKHMSEPQDHLQMMMRYAMVNEPSELNLEDMTRRLEMSNLGSFHQTSNTITNIIFNILASDPEYNTISIIRDEVSSVIAALGDKTWTKAGIAKMVRTDSIMRETLRLHSFANRSILRKVLAEGFKTEDGILVPKGAMISILAHPAQSDEDFFEEPLKFDPFRFSRIREATSATPNDPATTPTSNPLSFVSTGPQYLPFGHGRHACPGRFLVEFELKMMIAHIFRNYDIQLLGEYNGQRPETKWVAEAMIPDSSAKIQVRRRS